MICGVDATFLIELEAVESRLGRKRLLDTMLAATYFTHGVRDIVTSDARDYSVFGVFQIHRPLESAGPSTGRL